jgi:Ca-activated chloride channel family protein
MPVRPVSEPVVRGEVPTNLPDGWSHEAVFGRAKHAAAPGAAQYATARAAGGAGIAPAPMAMADQSLTQTSIILPQTATAAELKLIAGVLTMLAAVLLLVWQFRRGGRRA